MTTLYLSAAFLLIALVLFWLAKSMRSNIGIPSGRLIYIDKGKWDPIIQPLYDPELRLVGKPDYLVEDGDNIIPIEVKSSRNPSEPYDSHILQLAAYCVLIDRLMGKRPRYGIIHYPNRDFAIDYSAELEEALLSLIDEIHSKEKRKEVARSHNSSARCNRCGYRSVCEQRLS